MFHEITPLVQGLSLDEAFLDVTESQALLGEPAAIARRIKESIRARTGLTASVGVASNKLVAKIASDLDKPDGLTVVPESGFAKCWIRSRCDACPGSGVSSASGWKQRDCVPWASCGRRRMRSSGRSSAATRPDAGAGGRHRRPSGAADLEEKSLSAEDTFAQDLADPRRLEAQLSRLADLACERLRSRGLMAGRMGVKIRRHDFATFTRQRAIAPPTQDGRTVRNVAGSCFPAGSRSTPVRNFGSWGWS